MAATLALLLCSLLLWEVQGAQLQITSVSVGGVNQTVGSGNLLPFVDISPVSGVSSESYLVILQVENSGTYQINVSAVDVQLYSGTYPSYIPPNAPIIPIDSSMAAANLPVIASGGMWPEGIQFLIPTSNLPATTTCSPYAITIGVNTTFKFGTLGNASLEQVILPINVTPKCLTQTATSSGGQLKVSIEFSSPYLETYDSAFPFLIDFGDKLLELDPLKLVNVAGSDRIDYVYDVDHGKVYLMVYPNSTNSATDIVVSVAPSITTNAAGVPNTGASYTVHYVPNAGPIKLVSIVLVAAFAGVIVASWLTSFIVSSMQPWATAGSLGFGAIGFILWAQKLYLTGLISNPALPANYRIVSNIFSWASFQLATPWTWGASPISGVPTNVTSSSTVFATDALVVLGAKSQNYIYYYPSSVGGQLIPMMSPPPPVPQAPTSPVPIGQGPVASTPVPSPAAQAPAPGPSTIAPDSCMLTQNTDLFGGDLPNASFPSTSPQDCCTACLANPSCFAWTLSSVQNKCYLKAKTGWQLHANVTCCMSGTANRNGVIVSLPYPSPSPSMASSPGGGVTQSPNNPNVGNTGIPSPPTANAIGPSSSLGRRKLLELPFSQYSRRSMLQASSTTSGIRYIVTSMAPTADLLSLSTTVVQYSDAGEKAKFVIDMAVPDKLSQVYYRLESIGFWFGCVFLAACALNFGAWMFLKCCESEMPGVLYVPRMQLILLMLLMSALAYVGALLLVNNLGLIPLVVGITVVVCGPLLFLTASAFGIAAALYGKRKAVYLLSSRSSRQDSTQHSRWELVFVAQIMGMSLNRGKWRPPESSRKNEFVFRFGPLFEDCRGPLYQRRKVASNTGTVSLRRTHTSIGSDHSSQSGTASQSLVHGYSGSYRRRLMAIEEKPLTSCGRVRIKRSSYQAYGVVMAIARLAAYALAIGALDRWPAVQSGVLLSLGILYFVYLRFAVPYSRRDEMALEYWQAILDIALFVLLLVLSLAIDANNFLQVNNMGIGMLVVQGLGFIAYFINRSLIIVHAFSEVICSHCTSAAQPSRKKSSRRRKAQGGSLSNDGSISISVSEATLPPSQISVDHNGMRYGFNDASVQNHDLKVKPYPMMENPHSIDEVRMGREDKSNYHHSVAEAMMSRPGIFPAIAEESDMLQEVESPSVWLTERHRRSQNRSSPAAMLEHAYESSSRRVVSSDAVFQPKSPVDGANTSKQESQPLDVEQKSERQAIADPSQGGQKDVFDRFWSSF